MQKGTEMCGNGEVLHCIVELGKAMLHIVRVKQGNIVSCKGTAWQGKSGHERFCYGVELFCGVTHSVGYVRRRVAK